MSVVLEDGVAPPSRAPRAYLDVRDLRVHFPTDDGLVKSVDGMSFTLEKGQTLGIVGESGSGKSVTAQALLGLHKGTNARITGEIWLDGQELVHASAEDVRRLRGSKMAMIFQDPLSALHPYFKVGAQIAEGYRQHHPDASKAEARDRTIEMLRRVGIPNPDKRFSDYGHQFSGGMRQRVAIAIALLNRPDLIIADEPTTALDVTIQGQILFEMQKLTRETGAAMIWITHDLSVIAGLADRVCVMYAGRIVEQGTVFDVLSQPRHPYTRGLLDSVPSMSVRGARLAQIPGMAPSPLAVPAGCAFRDRCGYATDACRTMPEMLPIGDTSGGQTVRCFHPLAVAASARR